MSQPARPGSRRISAARDTMTSSTHPYNAVPALGPGDPAVGVMGSPGSRSGRDSASPSPYGSPASRSPVRGVRPGSAHLVPSPQVRRSGPLVTAALVPADGAPVDGDDAEAVGRGVSPRRLPFEGSGRWVTDGEGGEPYFEAYDDAVGDDDSEVDETTAAYLGESRGGFDPTTPGRPGTASAGRRVSDARTASPTAHVPARSFPPTDRRLGGTGFPRRSGEGDGTLYLRGDGHHLASAGAATFRAEGVPVLPFETVPVATLHGRRDADDAVDIGARQMPLLPRPATASLYSPGASRPMGVGSASRVREAGRVQVTGRPTAFNVVDGDLAYRPDDRPGAASAAKTPVRGSAVDRLPIISEAASAVRTGAEAPLDDMVSGLAERAAAVLRDARALNAGREGRRGVGHEEEDASSPVADARPAPMVPTPPADAKTKRDAPRRKPADDPSSPAKAAPRAKPKPKSLPAMSKAAKAVVAGSPPAPTATGARGGAAVTARGGLLPAVRSPTIDPRDQEAGDRIRTKVREIRGGRDRLDVEILALMRELEEIRHGRGDFKGMSRDDRKAELIGRRDRVLGLYRGLERYYAASDDPIGDLGIGHDNPLRFRYNRLGADLIDNVYGKELKKRVPTATGIRAVYDRARQICTLFDVDQSLFSVPTGRPAADVSATGAGGDGDDDGTVAVSPSPAPVPADDASSPPASTEAVVATPPAGIPVRPLGDRGGSAPRPARGVRFSSETGGDGATTPTPRRGRPSSVTRDLAADGDGGLRHRERIAAGGDLHLTVNIDNRAEGLAPALAGLTAAISAMALPRDRDTAGVGVAGSGDRGDDGEMIRLLRELAHRVSRLEGAFEERGERDRSPRGERGGASAMPLPTMPAPLPAMPLPLPTPPVDIPALITAVTQAMEAAYARADESRQVQLAEAMERMQAVIDAEKATNRAEIDRLAAEVGRGREESRVAFERAQELQDELNRARDAARDSELGRQAELLAAATRRHEAALAEAESRRVSDLRIQALELEARRMEADLAAARAATARELELARALADRDLAAERALAERDRASATTAAEEGVIRARLEGGIELERARAAELERRLLEASAAAAGGVAPTGGATASALDAVMGSLRALLPGAHTPAAMADAETAMTPGRPVFPPLALHGLGIGGGGTGDGDDSARSLVVAPSPLSSVEGSASASAAALAHDDAAPDVDDGHGDGGDDTDTEAGTATPPALSPTGATAADSSSATSLASGVGGGAVVDDDDDSLLGDDDFESLAAEREEAAAARATELSEARAKADEESAAAATAAEEARAIREDALARLKGFTNATVPGRSSVGIGMGHHSGAVAVAVSGKLPGVSDDKCRRIVAALGKLRETEVGKLDSATALAVRELVAMRAVARSGVSDEMQAREIAARIDPRVYASVVSDDAGSRSMRRDTLDAVLKEGRPLPVMEPKGALALGAYSRAGRTGPS